MGGRYRVRRPARAGTDQALGRGRSLGEPVVNGVETLVRSDRMIRRMRWRLFSDWLSHLQDKFPAPSHVIGRQVD